MNSSSRNGADVIWLAVHTTEGIMRAADLRAWATWPGSSHASSDEEGTLMTPDDGFVPYDRMAWTLRNGNPISENIEQCGWARWTRAEWLARPLLLDATARWLADRSKARGIPLVRLSAADIRARKPGVLGHGDYSVATGDGTHTDPGPGYPWDVVLAKAAAYRDGHAPSPVIDLRGPEMQVLETTDTGRIYTATDLEVVWVKDPAISASTQKVWGKALPVSQREVDVLSFDANARRARQRAEVITSVAAQVSGKDIDEKALGQVVVAGVLPQLTAALAAKTGATREDVEQIVRGVFGDAARTA